MSAINKLFFTNNICENIHPKIAKFIPNGNVSKSNFKDAIKYILNSYELKNSEIIRKDYITRRIIILIENLKINSKPQIISYNDFKRELENTIAVMTGTLKINSVKEILKYLDYEMENENTEDKNNIIEDTNLNENSIESD